MGCRSCLTWNAQWTRLVSSPTFVQTTPARFSGVLPCRAFSDEPLPSGDYPVAQLGQVLLGDYLVPFEVISVLLLIVMIGAAYLAKGRRRDESRVGNPSLSREAREWS